jgi:hypothetical protein
MGCHKPGNRRLLVSLIQGHSPDPGRVCSRSRWRWRRQYQARLCHDQRRGYSLA